METVTPKPSVSNNAPIGVDVVTPINVDVFMGASAHTNWATLNTHSPSLHNGYRLSSGVQNASVSFEVYFGVGTWEIDLMYSKGQNMGDLRLAVDGVTIGTAAGYNSAGAIPNTVHTFTPVIVTEPGIKTITITMATKNPSSTSYYGQIQAMKVRRPLV